MSPKNSETTTTSRKPAEANSVNSAKLPAPAVARSTRDRSAAVGPPLSTPPTANAQPEDHGSTTMKPERSWVRRRRSWRGQLHPQRQRAGRPVAVGAVPRSAARADRVSAAHAVARRPGPGTRPPAGAAGPTGPRRRRPRPAPPPPGSGHAVEVGTSTDAVRATTERMPASAAQHRRGRGPRRTRRPEWPHGARRQLGDGPAATIRPWCITTTWVQVCSTSDSRWLDTSTVRPVGRVAAQHLAHRADLRRIEAVGRLVEQQQVGQPEHRLGDGQPLPHALAVGAHRRSIAVPSRRSPAPRPGARPAGPAGGLPVQLQVRPCRTGAAGTRNPRRSADPGQDRRPGATSCPNTLISPAVGVIRPISIRSVVVLPAPFGPSRPSTCPGSTSKETSLTALKPPLYVLARSRTSSGRPPPGPAVVAGRRRSNRRPATQPSRASPSTTPIPIAGPSGTVLAVTGSPDTTGTVAAAPISPICQTAGSGVEV